MQGGAEEQRISPPWEEEPVQRVCRPLLWHTPLLLPLVVVVGVVCGGSWGWAAVIVALAVAHTLRMHRLLMCMLLCGAVTFLSQEERSRSAAELREALAGHDAVTLHGTVVRVLKSGCILETGWTGVRVAVRGDEDWEPGDVMQVTAELSPERKPLVEGMFAHEKWMRELGLAADMRCLHREKVGRSWGRSALVGVAGRMRRALAQRLMPPGTEGDMRRQTLCALVLGDKEGADPAAMEIFRRAGCLHAFAVSGLHVGLAAGILWLLLRLCRVRPAVGRYVTLVLVGLYVMATGMGVPALRAYIMLAALLGGLMLRRRMSLFNTWCFVALLLVMVEPWQLYQAGFQLSFAVYAAICLAVRYGMGDRPWFGPDSYIPPRIRTVAERRVAAAELAVRGAVVVSLSAWLVSLPLAASQFHVINTASYITNIAITPLLPVVMFFGLATLLLGALPLVGPCLHWAAVQSAGCLLGVVGFAGSFPGVYVPVQEPAEPHAYMVACTDYGKSFCVLGNPGVVLGELQRVEDARYSVAPALFHAGFTPALAWGDVDAPAEALYRETWPRLHMLSGGAGEAPRRFETAAGAYTFYFPRADAPRTTRGNRQPVVLWERKDGMRIMYMGDAALSTLEAVPEPERRADVLILGFNAKEPLLEPDLLTRLGLVKLILLPGGEAWQLSEVEIAPIRIERLSPGVRRLIRQE